MLNKKNAGVKYSIWWTNAKCLSSFFLKYPIVILFTICAGREFQTFTILLKKKCFASFDLKRLPMILKPLLRVVLVRSLVIWSFTLILSKPWKILNTSIRSSCSLRWINWITSAPSVVPRKTCFTIFR